MSWQALLDQHPTLPLSPSLDTVELQPTFFPVVLSGNFVFQVGSITYNHASLRTMAATTYFSLLGTWMMEWWWLQHQLFGVLSLFLRSWVLQEALFRILLRVHANLLAADEEIQPHHYGCPPWDITCLQMCCCLHLTLLTGKAWFY